MAKMTKKETTELMILLATMLQTSADIMVHYCGSDDFSIDMFQVGVKRYNATMALIKANNLGNRVTYYRNNTLNKKAV